MNKLIALLCSMLLATTCWSATTCRIVSGGALAFGTYDVLSPSPDDSLLNVVISCFRTGGPQSTTVTMQLGQGTYGGSVSTRRMRQIGGLGDSLSYGLYRDVSRSSVWGSNVGIDTVSVTLAIPNNRSASTTFVIYGRIPPQQDVAAGNYTDAVQMSVSP